jgi:uncharacterized membrane protein
MKRLTVFLAVCFILISTVAFAQLRQSTDAVTSDAKLWTVVNNKSVGFCGVIVVADGTNAASVTIYDNTANSGKKLASVTTPAGEYLAGFVLPYCVEARTGLYIDVGTNTTVFVHWTR